MQMTAVFFFEGCTVLQKDYHSHYESCVRTGQIQSSTVLGEATGIQIPSHSLAYFRR